MQSGEVNGAYFLRARTLAAAVELIEGRTATTAVVGAPEFWAVLPLVTGRRGSPSAAFQPDPTRLASSAGTVSQQIAVWDAAGVDHLLLEHGGAMHRSALEAVESACPGSIRVLGRVDDLALVRLDGEPACRRNLIKP
jgi:hypothetical protein